MKLIGRNLSPYTRRCAIALNLMGIKHERAYFSPWQEQQAAAIAAINPLKRVPILVLDDGSHLIESGAILDYACELAGPGKALIPAAGKARRDCLQIVALATGAMDKGVNAFYEKARRPAEKVHPPWHAHLQSQVAGGLAALEALPQTPWLQGAAISAADVTVAVAMTFLRTTNPELVPPGRYPKLDALTARAEAMPAFQSSPLEKP